MWSRASCSSSQGVLNTTILPPPTSAVGGCFQIHDDSCDWRAAGVVSLTFWRDLHLGLALRAKGFEVVECFLDIQFAALQRLKNGEACRFAVRRAGITRG